LTPEYIASASAESLIQQFSDGGDAFCEQHIPLLLKEARTAISSYSPRNKPLLDMLSKVCAQVNHEPSANDRIMLLIESCFYYERIGKSADGISCGEAARTMAQAVGNVNLERRACNTVSTVYADTANFILAAERLECALLLARQMNSALLETAALSNVVLLLKAMGLYQDAIKISDKVIAYPADTQQGQLLRFLGAGNGLFCAHRLRDSEAGLRYLRAGSELLNCADIDPASRATFEYYRALFLISEHDHETAELLISAAQQQLRSLNNDRIDIQLRIAAALCDWASRAPVRVADSKRELAALYEQTKKSGLYHDEVLRALMDVYSRYPNAGDADIGLVYAKELIEYTTGIKKAKFFRQLQVSASHDAANAPDELLDPLARVRAWLDGDKESDADADKNTVREPEPVKPYRPKSGVQKHDELSAIHDNLVKLRVHSLKRRIRTAEYDVAENWALAAEFFDDQTGQHCFRVGRLSGMLAREIGQDEEFCVRIEHAARLHDLGKIGVNEMILLKPGPLDPGELAAMRAHTEIGAHLLKGSKEPTLQMAAVIARYHHEWWGGGGYPMRLAGVDIPLPARICALADVYDALTHRRSYKAAWTHEAALEQMMVEGTSHFDPYLIKPFRKTCRPTACSAHAST
jgi:putative two-component system response regulator